MMTKHLLSIACFASLAASGCKAKDTRTSGASAPKTVAAPATTPTAPSVAPSAKLASAIQAVNACKPDEDCPALDQLDEAVQQGLGTAEYRGAIQLAKTRDGHRVLSGAVATKLDAPLLVELEQGADSCPDDGECQAEDDFVTATEELTPALFREGMKAAKKPTTKRDLLDAIRSKMDASLIPDVEPLIADPDVGESAQQALGAIEDTGALAKLAALLDRHDQTDTIHSRVPDILAKYPKNPSSQAALPKLREMAQHDAQGWGKADAACAIAKIQGEGSIPFLVDYLHTETWGPARARVVEELGTFKTNAVALANLQKLAKDADKDVSAAAQKALEAK